MKNLIKKTIEKIGNLLTKRIASLEKDSINIHKKIKDVYIDDYIQKNLFNNPKYSNPKKLNKYEHQIYSQNGEDGIIQEIFKRIKTINKFFVEFGVENGLECNTLALLSQNWKGLWLDGNTKNINSIKKTFNFLIEKKKLSIKQAFITAENIEELFDSSKIPNELDLLSIDIDGNDYWIWQSISNYSPRVVVIEYNSMFNPPTEFIVKYDANKVYPITSHFGGIK